ncbi:MAG: hypothetical protein AAB337_03795 [Patescibacteria group bacterium]
MEELYPIPDPTEARRRRAYRFCLTLSLIIIGGGSLYFLWQEVISFARAIPQEFSSPEVEQAVGGFKDVGDEASSQFNEDIKPGLQEVVSDMQTQIETVATDTQENDTP